jgi:4a-hydroxytetrahydrobiopterin dehydratase
MLVAGKRPSSRSRNLLPAPVPVSGSWKEARPVAEPLSDIGIQRELGGLPGWSRRGNSLTKTYRFPTFPAGITFVTRVADVAESMDHHPDIDIRHTRLTFTLSTHDVGGITSNDLALAREIERLASESGV